MAAICSKRVVGTNGRGLPPTIVAARVTLVQLEAEVLVPARPKERHTKWSQTAELRVPLLAIADVDDELFNGNRLLIGQCVALCRQSRVVDEDVGGPRDEEEQRLAYPTQKS